MLTVSIVTLAIVFWPGARFLGQKCVRIVRSVLTRSRATPAGTAPGWAVDRLAAREGIWIALWLNLACVAFYGALAILP